MALDTIALTSDGVQLLTGLDSIKARVVQRLLFLRGEWFLNQRQGVPYVTFFGSNIPSVELLQAEVKFETEKVNGVNSAEITVEQIAPRRYIFHTFVQTDFGDGQVDVDLAV